MNFKQSLNHEKYIHKINLHSHANGHSQKTRQKPGFMKTKLLFTIILAFNLLSSLHLSAQVGINNDGSAPASSAMLDVKSANKGVLIPQIALTGTLDVTTIASPATSLLIYNTATAGTSPNNVTPGYYYWSGTAWTRLSVFAGGSGTTNYIPKWTPTGSLYNSLLFDDGTNVGIGRLSRSRMNSMSRWMVLVETSTSRASLLALGKSPDWSAW